VLTVLLSRGRCLSPQAVECATLAAADRIRHEYGDCVIPRDDAREATVSYCGEAPRQARESIERIAYHSHHRQSVCFGQTPLTRFERTQIDFSRTNVFHARACKAIAAEFDVEDWIARYDHTLTVSEHVGIFERAGASIERGRTLRALASRRGL
jgi:hypothetical protein